jgi:O-glycosyl hydrolase
MLRHSIFIGGFMKCRFYQILFLSFFLFILSVSVFASNSSRIIVDPAVTHQEFEGWGTSLCWWANLEGSGSVVYRNKIAEILVDPDSGLGFTHFRYNIGGGDQPEHDHMRTGGAIPGYKPAETGAYDWTADQYQRNMVTALAEIGTQINQKIVWEAFSNSPPWWMTISGCAAGNVNGADNLKPDYFDDFADYLTEVVKHFRESWGIVFRTIEPFNEPSAGWWAEGKNQEGCGFKADQARMVKVLGNSLVAKGLFPSTSVSAADENAVNEAVSGLAKYDDSAFSFMTQINTHTYYGRTATNFANLATTAATNQKILWQSETGPLAGTGNQDIAMLMSQYIIQDLRMLKPNAWLDWQTVGSGDWGTFQVNRTSLALVPTRRFYLQAAFSRFIRPGARFIESSDSNSLAALVPSTGNLVLIIRNGGAASINYTWDLTRFTALGTTVLMYQYLVSNYQRLSKLPDVAIANKQFSITAPSQSVTTCVVPSTVEVLSKHLCGTRQQPDALAILSGTGDAISLSLAHAGRYSVTIFSTSGRQLGKVDKKGIQGINNLDLKELGLPRSVYCLQLNQDNAAVSGIFQLVR